MTDPSHRRGRARLPRVKKPGDDDPKVIGQWKIGRTIGKGSSGRVRIARHVKTHQYAAIKIVSKNALINSRMTMTDAPAQAEKLLLSIEREIVIMKLIDHPNVLNLYDVWETANELYLIMEYVEGGELFDYLISQGRVPVDEALHYFQQIISAISYCHGFNITHRDLKPENLLLSKSAAGQNIKVADFGMAAYTDPTVMLATSCGSPHYASPEVVEGRAYKGSLSDIWSCGVILYALLVGRLPFDHENLTILLEKVKMATFDMPMDVPPAARDLICRMLEKDVTRRITMSQIQTHPFFLGATPSPTLLLSAQTPTLDQLSCSIDRPVQCEEDIDADIFDNLRTLWHGAPARDIIDGLLSDEKTWEKAVYHLLLRYRTKHLEHYNMDEDDEDRQRQRQSMYEEAPTVSPCAEEPSEATHDTAPPDMNEETTRTASPRSREATPPSLTPFARPSAPTPQRAAWRGDETFLEGDTLDPVATSTPCRVSSPIAPRHPAFPALDMDTDVFTATPRRPTASSPGPSPLPLPMLPTLPAISVPTLPVINLQESSPMRPGQAPGPSDLSSNASSSPGLSPIIGLPGIVMPNLDNVDETVQRFFHQIVEHLNTMQMWQSQSTRSGSGSSAATPDPSGSDAPGPTSSPRPRPRLPATTPIASDDDRFEDATEESVDHGLGIDYQAARPPLQLLSPPPARKARYAPNASKMDKRAHDKENTGVQNLKDEGAGAVQVRKKSSLRKTNSEEGRAAADRRVHILLPSEDGANEAAKSPKAKKGMQVLLPRSAETSPALSQSDGGSFFLPGPAPRRSWFAHLFTFKPASQHLLSVHDAHTTRDACARLLRGFGVAVVLAAAEGGGVLKCRLDELKDPAGVMGVARAVRFRVELHGVTHAHAVAGYVAALTLVQEKGALSSFRLVYNRLRREWDLDAPRVY